MSKGQNKRPKDNSIFLKKEWGKTWLTIPIAKIKSLFFNKSLDFLSKGSYIL